MTEDTKKPICIDLFCGGGGLSLGLKMAGFRVCLGVEVDPAHYLVYSHNQPETPVLLTDIREIRKMSNILSLIKLKKKDIDLIAGGPPCQGFSLANKKTRNASNKKNDLVFEFQRMVKEVKPKAFLLENVIGLASLNDSVLFNDLISQFDRMKYNVNSFTLDASQYGVPQSRKRLFITGSYRGEIERPTPKYGNDLDRSFVTVKDALIGDLPMLNPIRGNEVMDYTSPPKNKYQKKIRKNCTKVYDHIITLNSAKVKERISHITPGNSLCDLIHNNSLPLNLVINCDHAGVYRRLNPDKPAATLGNFRKAMIIHPYQDRLLSLREAARLQSFPDRYRFPGLISHMQQVIGDAVPPILAKEVGRKIRRTIT